MWLESQALRVLEGKRGDTRPQLSVGGGERCREGRSRVLSQSVRGESYKLRYKLPDKYRMISSSI